MSTESKQLRFSRADELDLLQAVVSLQSLVGILIRELKDPDQALLAQASLTESKNAVNALILRQLDAASNG